VIRQFNYYTTNPLGLPSVTNKKEEKNTYYRNQKDLEANTMQKRLGRQTVALSEPVHILSYAAVGGKMESEGPLGPYFDHLCQDSFFGEKTWEKAEAEKGQPTTTS